jgi:hypothetical protein
METEDAIVEIFCKAYQGLKKKQRQQVANRILMDLDISEDWIDHVLIERARNEPGKDLSLDEFLASYK